MTEPPVSPPPPSEQPDEPAAAPPPFPPPNPYGAPPAPPQYPAPPAPYGQQPPPYGQPPSPYGQPWTDPATAYSKQNPKPGTNGFAIAALVFGIIPICFLGVIFAIVALIQTGKTGQKGKGFAIAGIVLTVLWVAGGVTAVVIAGANQADRDSNGKITGSGDISADSLKVGDCFNGLNDVKPGETVSTIKGVPCTDLHEAQDFAHVELPGDNYPGTAELQLQSTGAPCVDKLKEIAPADVRSGDVGVIWIYPTKIAWKLGNHHLECVAVSADKRTGSILE